MTPPNAATIARNVRSNDVYGSLAKRQSMNLFNDLCDTAITSLHRFYKSDGTAYLLGTCGSYLKLGNDDGTSVVLRDQLSNGLRWEWVTYQNKAIGCNGTDNCQKFDGFSTTTANTDGSRTANILTADLGAPFAQLNTGANLDVSSWYQYKIQFTDTANTYYSDALSNPILTGSTVRDVSLSDIPLGPSGTTSRAIYRTDGQASRVALASATYKLVASIGNNTSTTYDDAIADGALTTVWSTSGKVSLTPPKFKHITIHKERLFGGNGPNASSYIYWSYPFKTDIFDVADYELVRENDGDEITFIKPIVGKLAIGKTNSITNFETQSVDDTLWPLYTYSFIGCPAGYSAAVTPLGIVYLNWSGIYIYQGETSQLISDVVTKEIRDILASNLPNAIGIYFQNEYQLSYTSQELGESNNNRVLIFDTTRNSYVIDDKNINAFVVFDSGNDFAALYSGSSLSDGRVLAHTPSFSTLIIRLKSEFQEGTKDSIVISGTENMPELSIGWGIVINDSSMAGVTLDSLAYSDATINRPGLDGTWWSPALEVNANSYDKLFWNEDLGCCGNITFALRSAISASTVTANTLAWSPEFTDPSGSDLSALVANDFLQLRASFATTDITETPFLESLNNYVIKLIYSKTGVIAEETVNSLWESGFSDFGIPVAPKRIWGFDIYYVGTEGTLTVGFENDKGDIDRTFDIDLSVQPGSSSTDQYFGTNTHKIYKYLSPVNSSENPSAIGRAWKFSILEGGSTGWNIYRVDVKYSQEEEYED